MTLYCCSKTSIVSYPTPSDFQAVDFGTLLSCADAISASDIGLRNLISLCSSVTGRGSNEEEPISSFCLL